MDPDAEIADATVSSTSDIGLHNETSTEGVARPTSNIDISEIDPTTREKLKGDLIGDTVYSRSFIVKTLLRLHHLSWDDDLDDDLCFIAESLEEREVAVYLFALNVPSIICNVLSDQKKATQQNNRLVELLAGILEYLYHQVKESNELTPDEYEVVLSHLDTDDPFILTHIVRFIGGRANYSKCKLDYINSNVMEKLDFILRSSINVELLLTSLHSMSELLDNKVHIECVSVKLLESGLEAFDTICIAEEFSRDRLKLTENMQAAVKGYMFFFMHFCQHYNRLIDKQSDVYLNCLDMACNILTCFNRESSVYPYFVKDLDNIILALAFICPVMTVKCFKLFQLLIAVYSKVIHCVNIGFRSTIIYRDLLCYFISVLPIRELRYDNDEYKEIIFVLEDFPYSSYRHAENLKAICEYFS